MNQDELFDRVDRDSKNGRLKSEEEAIREDQERLERLVTPELLTYFSEKDALKLVRYFQETPSSGTQEEKGMPYDLQKLSEEAKQFLVKEIRGKKIIEIGDAGRRINECLLLRLGARSFETADAQWGVDGLTYLMRQPEGSAIVCSFGVLDWGVLYDDWINSPRAMERYRKLLGNEMYRVTPKGAITLHGLECFDDLKQAGFREEYSPFVPEDLDTWTPQRGGLKVLRKQNDR